MARGKVDSPNLDDRKWQDIVDQARALIPVYAPEWTDHNPSDLGMTLIELFAWLVEGMIYRLNRVPEKNLIEFLNLIGVQREPARPASTYLTYQIANQNGAALVIPQGSQAATAQTETEAGIVFETDEALRALPVNLKKVLLIRRETQRYEDITAQVAGVPLGGITLSIPGRANPNPQDPNYHLVAFGFDGASEQPLALQVRLLQPLLGFLDPKNLATLSPVAVTWQYLPGDQPPFTWSAIPAANLQDQTIQTVKDSSNNLKHFALRRHGAVVITLPAALQWAKQSPTDWPISPAQQPVTDALFWIGLRIPNSSNKAVDVAFEHVLFNSVRATHALSVGNEVLGVSSGKPFQSFALRHQPLYKDRAALDPYAHLQIQVREVQLDGAFGPWNDWRRVGDFPEGEGRCYRLNPVAGVIDFGNFHSQTAPDGNGTIPPNGSEIRALTYRYVAGGAQSNVAGGTVRVIRTAQPGVSAVNNPGRATGGVDEEPIEETKRRGPKLLRNRYRAVTVEDYEFLAQEASPQVKKVRALAARQFTSGPNTGQAWSFGEMVRAPGSVHVIIVPDAAPEIRQPIPTDELLLQVTEYLEQRLVITTRLLVTQPRYLPIKATVDLKVWNSAIDSGLISNEGEVRDKLLNDIMRFLHPIHGGPDGRGWEVGQDVTIAALFEFIQPDPAKGLISKIEIEAPNPPPRPPSMVTDSKAWVQLADYELICSVEPGLHTVTVQRV